ncbi:uncharacterized protein BDZ99DRAFT_502737 [Mytilinidion resinicola]|uniref:Fucose-specific lectin n=1 Tax=Mytilinidion resinicola TaxID=574789 RepID=A0A6A6Y878_9PEZI|nr:uncharacterized protein BDZ99DRAFT_502737 [Mytilinidion resinicola]KAF2804345.1 hypothetical protein BDZ99DRAFT_502737 [Mytilinidion resinicola]
MPDPTTTTPGATKSTDPRSAVISGCIVDGKSTIFYTDEHGFLHTLQNKINSDVEPLATQGRVAYDDNILTLGGQNVKSLTRDIAAISFPLAGANFTRSRLYYIDTNSTLQELQKEGSEDWKVGQLGKDLGVIVKKHSPITAFLSVNSDSIKVYYYKDGAQGGKPYVAFWNGTSKKWFTEYTG